MPGNEEDIIVGHRDILINMRDGGLRRISNTHRSCMSLLYDLLFPRVEDGWDLSMGITQKAFYTYRLQIRHDTLHVSCEVVDFFNNTLLMHIAQWRILDCYG